MRPSADIEERLLVGGEREVTPATGRTGHARVEEARQRWPISALLRSHAILKTSMRSRAIREVSPATKIPQQKFFRR